MSAAWAQQHRYYWHTQPLLNLHRRSR